jgi:hypothetical protein
MSRAPLMLLLLLVSSLATLAHAQQQSRSSTSSPAVRTPYSCFYDECPASSSTLPDKAQFESCLRAGERSVTTQQVCCYPPPVRMLCTL